jgi:hypothetical protein
MTGKTSIKSLSELRDLIPKSVDWERLPRREVGIPVNVNRTRFQREEDIARDARMTYVRFRTAGEAACADLDKLAVAKIPIDGRLRTTLKCLIERMYSLDKEAKSESVMVSIAGCLREMEALLAKVEPLIAEHKKNKPHRFSTSTGGSPHLLPKGIFRENLYSLLGAGEGWSMERLVDAYRERRSEVIARRPEDKGLIDKIDLAWSILRNPELRAEYDAVRHVGYDSWKAKRRNGDALDHCFPGSFGSGG